ncbi:MAG TPA: SCO family protein, partial [Acetobacteraceae bacterium]|nr:SCO family protein [Acetobacteraceae bacterium]
TGAFSPRIVGLTGTPEQVATVEREYHVYAAKHVTGPGPNDYAMDHSSVLYLMGPDGRFIAPIDADQTAPQLAQSLAGLIS